MNRPDRTIEAGSIVSSPPRVVNVMGFPAVFRRAKQVPGPLSDEGPTGRHFISSPEGFPAPAALKAFRAVCKPAAGQSRAFRRRALPACGL